MSTGKRSKPLRSAAAALSSVRRVPFLHSSVRLRRVPSGRKVPAYPARTCGSGFSIPGLPDQNRHCFRNQLSVRQQPPPERAAPVFQYLDSPTRIVIVFAISCQYDNSRPRHHAVANHQNNMPSYRVVSTLPIPAMIRAAHPAQDGGYERPEHQAEDDDKDQGQSIFHNPEL